MRSIKIRTCKFVLAISLVLFWGGTFLMTYYMSYLDNNSCRTLFRNMSVISGRTRQSGVGHPVSSRNEHFKLWNPPVMHSNPSHWPGEMGRAVVIPPEDEELQKEKFKLNMFNVLASDRMALNRTLPDVRDMNCRDKRYAPRLPATSVVIVFHNEAWSTLLRTIHSVIRTSPRELVEEIILVDDASERDYLGKQLEDYVSKLEVPVKVLRTVRRGGLVRARLMGAAAVRASVITFLDAHCECSIGWLEPLLDRIAEDRTRVVCPVIDSISDSDFEYRPMDAYKNRIVGGFDWRLGFDWFHIPPREVTRRNGDITEPVRNPTMAGGLFAIDKSYFNEIGKYDEGMETWGGENLEMSFRVWMCGGTLELVTCSHVGHVYRKKTPYTFPGGIENTILRNNVRLAEVWLDEWKDFYYTMLPNAKKLDPGNLTERRNLRKKLKCKSFRWYLENIYPEIHMPLDNFHLGEIRSKMYPLCLDTLDRHHGQNVAIVYCHGQGGYQVFAYTRKKQIMSNILCLDASLHKGPVKLIRCNGKESQLWEYDEKKQYIKHVLTGTCLDVPLYKDENSAYPLLKNCDGRATQRWIIKK